MAPDFKSYLATQIIAEKQTVSYRNVARALKVHVNAAKCMLYEFYERETKKSAGSVYATYLIAGTKAQTQVATNGQMNQSRDDGPMDSSPPPFTSSMLDPSQHSEHDRAALQVPVRAITLVREETLDSVKKEYGTISSIHIYSVSPGRLPDLVTLTEIGRDLFVNTFTKEDPLKDNKTYGVIQNPDVRRRKGKRPPIPETDGPKFAPVKDTKKEPAADKKSNVTETPSRNPAASKNDSASSSQDSSTVASTIKPSLKKDNSNLFKAFAKQQNKPKLNRQDTDQSTNASVSGAEDVKMTDAEDEGESDDEALFLDTNTKKVGTKKRPSDIQKERDDKAAKLRKMMEDDNEPADEEATLDRAVEAEKDALGAEKDKKHDDADEVEWSASDSEAQKPEPEQSRKRRGKRKVTRKRTMKDEDGYLVTKEEAVWESFSEDEPEPAKGKPKSAFSDTKAAGNKAATTTTATKGEGKKKGNIMSFFGKK